MFQACARIAVINPKDPLAVRKLRIQRRYAEFLSLPLVLEKRNLLCFSVAHRNHGRQMESGVGFGKRAMMFSGTGVRYGNRLGVFNLGK